MMNEDLVDELNRDVPNNFTSDHVHPRVTAKKTFFDVHHPDDNAEHGRTIYDTYQTRDIMKPILQISNSDLDSTPVESKTEVSSIPNTWGSLDVEPTQPEEIEHLITPSIRYPESPILEEKSKLKKKMFSIFQKRPIVTTTYLKTFENSRVSKDEVMTPEEEFRRLKEGYARKVEIRLEGSTTEDPNDGEMPIKYQILVSLIPPEQKLICTKDSTGRPSIHKSSGHTSSDIQEDDIDDDTKISLPKSLQDKHSTISTIITNMSNVNISNFRNLRDIEYQPGPSKMRDIHLEHPNSTANYDKIVDMAFKTPTIQNSGYGTDSNKEVQRISDSDSLESITEMVEDGTDIISFNIDNIFSDFSLHNIDRDKRLLKNNFAETITSKLAEYDDLAQLSSSTKLDEIEGSTWTVSNSETIHQTDVKFRESSSFTDKGMSIKCPEEAINAVKSKVASFNSIKVPKKQSNINQESDIDLLSAIIRQVHHNNFTSSFDLLRTNEIIFNTDLMVFHCYNLDLRSFLTEFLENVNKISFENVLKNNLSGINSVFKTAFPKVITDILYGSQVCNEEICDPFSEISKSLQFAKSEGNEQFPFVLGHPLISTKNNEITQQIAKTVVRSENSKRMVLIASLVFMPQNLNSNGMVNNFLDFYSELGDYRLFAVRRTLLNSTSISMFLRRFLCIYRARSFQNFENVEWRDNIYAHGLSLIRDVLSILHFTYI